MTGVAGGVISRSGEVGAAGTSAAKSASMSASAGGSGLATGASLSSLFVSKGRVGSSSISTALSLGSRVTVTSIAGVDSSSGESRELVSRSGLAGLNVAASGFSCAGENLLPL